MNSVKNGVILNNGVTLEEEIKDDSYLEAKEDNYFEVHMSWYEIHDGKVKVKASSREEAEEIVLDNISEYMDLAKKTQETFHDSTTEEVYNVVLIKEDAEKEDELYGDRFDKDVYITTTSYHSANEDNILEIGRVKYRDYNSKDRLPYKFSQSQRYDERFDYYNVGACPSRSREESIFKKGDYPELLSKNLSELENKYSFAKSIDEVVDSRKYLLMTVVQSSNNSSHPKTLQVRAVKALSDGIRCPFKINLIDNQFIKFASEKELESYILDNLELCIPNNKKINLFLCTTEGIKELNKFVESSIGYTFK